MNEHDKREILDAIESARNSVTKAGHAQAQQTRDLIRRRSNRLYSAIQQLAEALKPKPQPIITGGEIMFVLPDDQPDVSGSISAIDVSGAKDKEGNAVAVTVTELFVTSNADAVAIIFADGSSESNPRSFTLKIGSPGSANLNYSAVNAADPAMVFKAGGGQFTITTGTVDPSTVSGGDLVLTGITES